MNPWSLLIATLALVSCGVPTTPRAIQGVTIAFQTTGRTVVAGWENVHHYAVTLTHSATKEVRNDIGATKVVFGSLREGEWSLDAVAVSSTGAPVASGSATFVVAGGVETTVTVPVTTSQNGQGTFRFKFQFPKDLVGSIEARLTRNGNAIGSTVIDGAAFQVSDDASYRVAVVSGSAVNNGTEALASGSYLLFLRFVSLEGTTLAQHVEAINIWDNMASDSWLGSDGKLYPLRTFQATEFASLDAQLAGLEVKDGQGTLVSFSATTEDYEFTTDQDEFTITPTPKGPGQRLEYALDDGAFGRLEWGKPTIFPFVPGQRITLLVTATDHVSQQMYRLASAFSTKNLAVDLGYYPAGLTGDPEGNLYVVDRGNVTNSVGGRILKFTPDGQASVLTGTNEFASTDGPAASARLFDPYGIARDAAGNLYFTEDNAGKIRKLSTSGEVSTLATGFNRPSGIAVSADGKFLYIADRANYRIVRYEVAKAETTVLLAGLANPDAVALTPDEKTLYVGANGDGTVRKIDLQGMTSKTVLYEDSCYPYGVAVDDAGNAYVCLLGYNRIKRITPEGTVTDVVGNGAPGNINAVGTQATVDSPFQIYWSTAEKRFYFTERAQARIRSFQ